jgi:Putative polyhydroxyalkanoic acid system protein (PHA_gran_rgn)
MARLNLAVEHDLPMDQAQAKFEAGIDEAMSRYGSWVGRLDWSDDRQSVRVTGSGYDVRLWYDERLFHAQGHIPLAWKLFVGALRHQIRKVIERPL